jgi:hypothetical protein
LDSGLSPGGDRHGHRIRQRSPALPDMPIIENGAIEIRREGRNDLAVRPS